MAEKPEAKWEPGTLDNTRRNIGPIDAEEAKKMMQKLGGEVFAEKPAPIDYSALPKAKEYSKRVVGRSASSISSQTANSSSISSSGKVGFATKEKPTRAGSLPELTSKERALMDRIMMSDDYKIIFKSMLNICKNSSQLSNP